MNLSCDLNLYRFFKRIVIFAGLTLLCASMQARCAKGIPPLNSPAIPILYDAFTAPVPVVMVKVDDSEPLPFFIDTGTKGIFITTTTARNLGLKLSKQKGETYSKANISKLEIVGDGGDIAVRVLTKSVTVEDADSLSTVRIGGMAVSGILGMQLLKSFVVQFDFQSKVFRITTPDNFSRPLSKPLPLNLEDDVPFVNVSVDDISSITMLVDTGSGGIYVSESMFQKISKGKRIRAKSISTVKGLEVVQSCLSNKVSVALDSVAMLPVSTTKDTVILGMPFLSQFVVTFDFPSKNIYLERKIFQSKIDGDNVVLLKQDGNTFVVSSTSTQFPLNANILQKGDFIVRVDGKEVNDLSLSVVQRLLNGYAGTIAKVDVIRQSKHLSVEFLRPSAYTLQE